MGSTAAQREKWPSQIAGLSLKEELPAAPIILYDNSSSITSWAHSDFHSGSKFTTNVRLSLTLEKGWWEKGVSELRQYTQVWSPGARLSSDCEWENAWTVMWRGLE